MWASLFGVYDASPPPMQAICNELTVFHHAGPAFLEAIGRSVGAEVAADAVEREVPLSEHPAAHAPGQLLSCSTCPGSSDSSQAATSDVLLRYLNSCASENPNIQVRWHWRAFDLAVWDEASTNDRALSDHFPQHRIMLYVATAVLL